MRALHARPTRRDHPSPGVEPGLPAFKFLDTSVVAEAFLHHEERLVDKGGCISFQGRKYETKPSLIGFRVEISYDPASPETITIRHKGIEPFTAKPLEMRPFCDKKDPLPISMQETEPDNSRMLEALEKKSAALLQALRGNQDEEITELRYEVTTEYIRIVHAIRSLASELGIFM